MAVVDEWRAKWSASQLSTKAVKDGHGPQFREGGVCLARPLTLSVAWVHTSTQLGEEPVDEAS